MNAPGGKNPGGTSLGTRAPTPTATSTRVTRQSSSTLPPPQRDEIVSQSYSVKDAKGGAAYLTKTLLCLVGEPFTTEHLTTILLHITQIKNMPLQAIEAIRSVAFLLEQETISYTAQTLTAKIKDDLTSTISNSVIAAISPQIAKLFQVNDSLGDKVNQLSSSETRTTCTHDDETLSPLLQKLETSTSAMAKSLEQTQQAIDKLTPALSTTQSSYSDAVKRNLPIPEPSHISPAGAAAARASTRERQILLDPLNGHALYTGEQTNETIADKITSVLEVISEDDTPPIEVKALTRLRNGGLILELDSALSVAWLRSPDNKAKFLEVLGTLADIKDRRYDVLVPFLPTSFNIEDSAWHRRIEEENGLTEGAIMAGRWIKEVTKRSPNQRVAHGILSFTAPNPANLIIKDGLYIGKEKLHPRKEKRDPLRCVKCQGWGHLAKNCKALHDTCAGCGHAHRTDQCDDPKGTKYCVNCKEEGHGSNAHTCPTFLAKSAELDAKIPENSMPFFPTDEPWTQVMLPPKPLTHPRPAPAYRKATLRQTTLDKHRPEAPPTNTPSNPPQHRQPHQPQTLPRASPPGINPNFIPLDPSRRAAATPQPNSNPNQRPGNPSTNRNH